MKVDFTNRNCTLFSRYSRMKVHMWNADSNLAALIRALKCLQPIQTLNYAFLVQTNESEIAGVQPLLRFSWFKPETALNGDWMAIQNRCLHFAQRNVFGLRRCLWVLNWSGNTNRGSNATSGCRENWESRSLHMGEERSWRFKIAVSDARGGMFSAFAGD